MNPGKRVPTPRGLDKAVRYAIEHGLYTASQVLNVGYVRDLVCNRGPDSRLLTVVESWDGRGVCYDHYFVNAIGGEVQP